MIDPKSFISGRALLHGKQGPTNVDVERIVKALLGNGAKWLTELAKSRTSKEDVNATLLLFDCLEQPIEVGEIAGIALHAGDVLADFFDCFVELFLAAASDEDISTLLDE